MGESVGNERSGEKRLKSLKNKGFGRLQLNFPSVIP